MIFLLEQEILILYRTLWTVSLVIFYKFPDTYMILFLVCRKDCVILNQDLKGE